MRRVFHIGATSSAQPTRCAFLLCEPQPAYPQMNPSSNSTSTLSASPPASVAEKPPRPPFSPKPPDWASASPSLGETASATTFSSTPDTAISGAFRSNPPSATQSRYRVKGAGWKATYTRDEIDFLVAWII